MKIERVEITNYGGLDSLSVIARGGNVVIDGPNGSGKSSVLDALRLALFGRNGRTNKAGRGPGTVTDGADTAAVHVVTDGAEIDVSVARSGKLEWEAVDTATGEAIATPAGLWPTPAVFAAAELAASLGACKTTEDVCELLRSEADAAYTWEAVCAAAPGHDTGDAVREIEEQSGHCVDDIVGLAAWRAVGDAAYTRRTAVNKQLAELQSELDGLPFVAPARFRGDSVGMADMDMLATIRKSSADRLETLRIRHELAKRAESSPSLAEARERVADAKVALEAAHARAKASGAAVAVRQAEWESARTARDNLASELAIEKQRHAWVAKGKCPTCGQPWSESLSAGDLSALSAKHEAAIVAVESLCAALLDADRDHETSLGIEQDCLHEFATAKGSLEAAQIAQPTGSAVDLAAEIGVAETTLADAEAAIAAIEARQHADGLGQAVAQVNARVAVLTQLVDDFRNHGGRVLCRIAEASGPPAAVEDASALLAKHHGAGLGWTGSGLTWRQVGSAIPLEHASTGEQWLARWALCNALAAPIGAPVIIDNLDCVDADNAQGVMLALAQCDQAIVAGLSAPHGLGESAAAKTTRVQLGLQDEGAVW